MSFRRLTQKQVAFIRSFVVARGRNATRAAIQAGYSAKTAHAIAHQLLHRDHVLAAIGSEPGGAAVLDRLARRSGSHGIQRRAAMLLSGKSTRVVGDEKHVSVFTDSGEAAARRYAVDHQADLGPPNVEKPDFQGERLIDRVDRTRYIPLRNCLYSKT